MQPNTAVKLLLSILLICLATAQNTSTVTTTQNTSTITVINTNGNSTISIITGPVIGKVTNTTARILLEFNTNTTITVILTGPNNTQIRSQRTVTSFIPVPFVFEGLQPNTRYNVTLDDPNINMTRSYFTTLGGQSGRLNFAVVSSTDRDMQLANQPEANLWADLLERVQNNQVDYLFQIGNQVYMDDPSGNVLPEKPYYACLRLLNSTTRDRWNDTRPQCLELLRNEYRGTWGIPSIRQTLAKIPQLTILNDHEVRRDWGYLPQDYNPDSADYFYGQLARQVYYEYQRQLREDVDFNNLSNMTQEYYYETLNDIGFFFVDYRGVKTWNRPYSEIETLYLQETQLGGNQTRLLQQVLNPSNGTFANVSKFFLVSPIPLVFPLSQMVFIEQTGGFYTETDAKQSWTYAYSDELVQLFEVLRDWELANGGEVTILTDDVNMGGYTDISHDVSSDNRVAFLQFTTSPIAGALPDDGVWDAFQGVVRIQTLPYPWRCDSRDWVRDSNYGIVIARNVSENNQGLVSCYLVTAPGNGEVRVKNDDGGTVDESNWRQVLESNVDR